MPCAGRLARAEQKPSKVLCVHFEKSLFYEAILGNEFK
jgi:hypothetical protein